MKTIKLCIAVILCSAFSAVAQDKNKTVVADKKIALQEIQSLNAIPSDMLSDHLKSALKVETGTIAPAQGTVYTIISSTDTTFNDCFNCGPAVGYETSCIAKYTIETRQYTEYRGGQVNRVWMSTVSVFKGCGRW